MSTIQQRRRAGFSLIELMVVIAVLAVLAAIGTGAYFRIRSSSQVKGTEETVAKLSSGFQQVWSAELDNARDSFAGKSGFQQFATRVDLVKNAAEGNPDRARAIWTYWWMKNAFPQTIAEATTNTTLQPLLPASVFLEARPSFRGLVAGTLSNPDQAAVILYIILTQKGSRGATFSEEATGSLTTILPGTAPGTQYRVFSDTFGNPITYVVSSIGIQNDLNSPEYLKTTLNISNDPFDPTGTLLRPAPPPPSSPRPVFWPNNSQRYLAASVFGRLPNPMPMPTPMPLPYEFSSDNWQPTIISRGLYKDWDPTFLNPTHLNRGLPANYFRFEPIPDGYICGYKLRRSGNRGDQ